MAIFRDDADRWFFIRRLGSLLQETGTPAYSFALIPNHFHLLLRRDETSVSKVMLRLLTSYALYFNKRHQREGHLFQNRYKATVCQESTYFLELVRYINLNPLNAGAVKSLEELSRFRFASHSYILGRRQCEWFQEDLLLSHFGKKKGAARAAYNDFISAGHAAGHAAACAAMAEKAIDEGDLIEGLGKPCPEDKYREPQPTFEDLLEEVSRDFQVPKARITGRTKIRGVVEARRVLAYRLSSEAGMTGCDIARILSLSRSTISKMIRSGESRMLEKETKETTSP